MSNEFDPTETEAEDVLEIDLGDQAEQVKFKGGENYQFTVSNVEPHTSAAGNKSLKWTLRFPDVNNWSAYHYTGLTREGVWKTEEIAVALGLAKKGEKYIHSKRNAIGRRGLAKMKLETYEGKERGKVDKVLPHPKGPIDDSVVPF